MALSFEKILSNDIVHIKTVKDNHSW